MSISIWVHVALLKLDRNLAVAGFIEHMLNAPSSKEQAEFYTRASSNRDLGLTRMGDIVLPLPPIDEQRLIVSELDTLQAKVDAVKALQTEAVAELDAILPAILDKAFKGEL
jgi:type I restriction enzyme S subunit